MYKIVCGSTFSDSNVQILKNNSKKISVLLTTNLVLKTDEEQADYEFFIFEKNSGAWKFMDKIKISNKLLATIVKDQKEILQDTDAQIDFTDHEEKIYSQQNGSCCLWRVTVRTYYDFKSGITKLKWRKLKSGQPTVSALLTSSTTTTTQNPEKIYNYIPTTQRATMTQFTLYESSSEKLGVLKPTYHENRGENVLSTQTNISFAWSSCWDDHKDDFSAKLSFQIKDGSNEVISTIDLGQADLDFCGSYACKDNQYEESYESETKNIVNNDVEPNIWLISFRRDDSHPSKKCIIEKISWVQGQPLPVFVSRKCDLLAKPALTVCIPNFGSYYPKFVGPNIDKLVFE